MAPEIAMIVDVYHGGGPGAVINTLEHFTEEERDRLLPLVRQVVPEAVINFGAVRYQRAMIEETRPLLDMVANGELKVVGPPCIALLHALASWKFDRVVRFILTGPITPAEEHRISRNVPRGLNAEFESPSKRLPVVRVGDVVAAIGFAANRDGAMVLVDREVPGILGQMLRWREGAGAQLLEPDLGQPVFERTSTLIAASRMMFRPPNRPWSPLAA
jgi:hypothetical protein